MKIPQIRRLASGAYFCQLRINGQSISITDDDKDIVYAKAVAIKAGLLKDKRKPDNITLGEAIDQYIDTRRSRLSPSTIQGYEKIRNNNFQSLMERKISEIDYRALDKSVDLECSRITRRGVPPSPKTIHNAYMLVTSVLRRYNKDIDTSVRLPEIKQRIPVIIPPEILLNVIHGSSIELPCLLAMWLSLSMSEIRGLTKSKSLINGKLAVVETVIDIHGQPIRKAGGKEEQRSRVLDVPPYIMHLINLVEGDVIVPLSGQTIYKRFKVLLEKNGLPHMGFHMLRHVNATVMAMLNIPTKEAQERGGWKTDYTMKKVYMHTFTEQRSLSDKKINNYFEDILKNINANENANENLKSL